MSAHHASTAGSSVPFTMNRPRNCFRIANTGAAAQPDRSTESPASFVMSPACFFTQAGNIFVATGVITGIFTDAAYGNGAAKNSQPPPPE